MNNKIKKRVKRRRRNKRIAKRKQTFFCHSSHEVGILLRQRNALISFRIFDWAWDQYLRFDHLPNDVKLTQFKFQAEEENNPI